MTEQEELSIIPELHYLYHPFTAPPDADMYSLFATEIAAAPEPPAAIKHIDQPLAGVGINLGKLSR